MTNLQHVMGQSNFVSSFFLYVLLTVYLSIFILVINQHDAQIFCFTISFISFLYMFRAPCAHHQDVKIVLYSIWYHHTYTCDDNRGCVMQFWPPDDEHMCSKHVQAWNKTYCKTKILCIKLVNYWDKYTEIHGQQNIKKKYLSIFLILLYNRSYFPPFL